MVLKKLFGRKNEGEPPPPEPEPCGLLLSHFDTAEMDLALKQALPETFREFRPYLGACRFVGCSHTREQGCAVCQAVERGEIARCRHESYIRLYEELKPLKEWEHRRGK